MVLVVFSILNDSMILYLKTFAYSLQDKRKLCMRGSQKFQGKDIQSTSFFSSLLACSSISSNGWNTLRLSRLCNRDLLQFLVNCYAAVSATVFRTPCSTRCMHMCQGHAFWIQSFVRRSFLFVCSLVDLCQDWLGLFLGSSALNDSVQKSNHKAPMPWTELLKTLVSVLPSSLKWWSPTHTEYQCFFVQVRCITQSCRCGSRSRFVRRNGMMPKSHQSWCRKLFYFYFIAYMFITYLNTLISLSVEYTGVVRTGLPWAQDTEESPWGLAMPTHFPGLVHGPLWFDLHCCLGLKRRKMIVISASLSFLCPSDDPQILQNTPSWERHIKIVETNSSRHIVGVNHNSTSVCVTTPLWLGVSCLGMGMCHHILPRSEASPYGQLYLMHATSVLQQLYLCSAARARISGDELKKMN